MNPIDEEIQSVALQGRVTSGNGTILQDADWAKKLATTTDKSVLISFEGLLNRVVRTPEETLPSWESWRRDLGCDQISILLFIRDPIEHAASQFQQAAKTAHVTQDSLSQYFFEYERPIEVARALHRLNQIETISTLVRNYSRCKKELPGVAEHWLGLESGALSTDDIPKSVNRSLTFAELRVVLALSRYSRELSLELANRFSNTLPNKKSFRAVPPLDVQERVLEKLEPSLVEIDELVGKNDQLKRTMLEPTNGQLGLDAEQWKVLRQFAFTDLKTFKRVAKSLLNRNKFAFG